MGDYVIYVHRNKINGKRYIGITNNIHKRWYGKGKHYDGCPHFWAAINKYGWDSFTHTIILSGLTLEEANYFEREYIAKYKTQDKRFGYNITSGGNFAPTMTGKHHSEATKEKMRESAKGRVISKEQRLKQSIAMTGKLIGINNPKRKPVRCINTGEVFVTQREAAQIKGVSQSKISLCCQGKRTHTHGLRWEYFNEEVEA